VPLETVRFPLPSTVNPATVEAALESKPEVIVTAPEIVGVAVQEVGPTVNDNPFKVVAAADLPIVKPVWFVFPMPKVPVTSQRELAAPVRLRAPAEVMAKVPKVVVERVKGPEATVIVNPPVVGPVIVLAVVPENVRFPPEVNNPVPVVMGPLPVVWIDKVLAPISQVDAAAPVNARAPPEFRDKALAPVVERAKVLLATANDEAAPEAKATAPADELPIDTEPVEEPVLIKVL